MRAKYLCDGNSYNDFLEACRDVKRTAKREQRNMKITKFNADRGKFETIKVIKP